VVIGPKSKHFSGIPWILNSKDIHKLFTTKLGPVANNAFSVGAEARAPLRMRSFNLEDSPQVKASPPACIIPDDQRL
jgi:hypothetical protein